MAKIKDIEELRFTNNSDLICICSLIKEEKIKILSKDYKINKIKIMYKDNNIKLSLLTKKNEKIEGDLRIKPSTYNEVFNILKNKNITKENYIHSDMEQFNKFINFIKEKGENKNVQSNLHNR